MKVCNDVDINRSIIAEVYLKVVCTQNFSFHQVAMDLN